MKTAFLSVLAVAGLSAAQDLATALQGYPDASQFASRIPDIADDLVTTNGRKYTLLIPSNKAFEDFATAKGQPLASFPQDQRRAYLRYHVLVGSLTSGNFSAPSGLTVPSLLKDEQYNNRTAGSALTQKYGADASGQVLFIGGTGGGGAARKFRVRQVLSPGGAAQVTGGLSENATLSAIDGSWSGGKFQIVDKILEPPRPCSSTIRNIPDLSSLDNALNRSGIWPVLDKSKNVTCLAPSTLAFANAGNADKTLSQAQLIAALEFHTLPQPIYSDFFVNGLTFTSFANLTVKVTVNSTGSYFNDAKVIQQNVLTNNGLIHILDKVMSPIAGEKLPETGNGTSSGNGTTSKPSAAVGMTSMLTHSYFAAMVGFVVTLLI